MRNLKLTSIAILIAFIAWSGIAVAAETRMSRGSSRRVISLRRPAIEQESPSVTGPTRTTLRWQSSNRSRSRARPTRRPPRVKFNPPSRSATFGGTPVRYETPPIKPSVARILNERGAASVRNLNRELLNMGGSTTPNRPVFSDSDFSARPSGIHGDRRRRYPDSGDRDRVRDERRDHDRGPFIITRDGKRIPIALGRDHHRRPDEHKDRHHSSIRFSVVYVWPYSGYRKIYLDYGGSYSRTSTQYIAHVYSPADYRTHVPTYGTVEGTLTTLASGEIVLVVEKDGEKVIYALEVIEDHLDWIYESGELPLRVIVIGYASGARNGYPVIRVKSLGLTL